MGFQHWQRENGGEILIIMHKYQISQIYCEQNKSLFSVGFYSRDVILSDMALTEVESKLTDGDHQITDCRVSVMLFPLHVHRKVLGGLVAVISQFVFTHTRELVHISIKRLEVISAPGAAGVSHMVAI